MDGEEFDFTGNGQQARDEGIEEVRGHNETWMERCMHCLPDFRRARRREPFIGEDLRHFCEMRGHVPKHHNAWGALLMNAVRRGIIEGTGQYRQMEDKSSHARASQLYRFITER